MQHRAQVDIGEPQERVASLYSDPRNAPQWMRGVERCVLLTGEPGALDSTYRLVPREGGPEFVATVAFRRHPSEIRLVLDSATVSIAVKATFTALPGDRTLLVSEERLTFKTPRDKLRGFFAGPALAKAHKRQLVAFKGFAESRL